MTATTVRLAAIVVREGRVLLVQPAPGEPWTLPGGLLPEASEDIPREMRTILESLGLQAHDIEDDFLETRYSANGAGRAVLNLYAPTNWDGDPRPAPGGDCRWFALEEMIDLTMDDAQRDAVFQAFGVERDDEDPADEALAQFVRHVLPHDDEPAAPHGAGDVLSTLNGGRGSDVVERGMRRRYGELADDIFIALGRVWTGPELDRKTRSLLVVAMVAAQGGRADALRAHLDGALNHGATPDELRATLRMVATYAGFPAAMEAWPVMEQAITDRQNRRPRKRK